MKQDVNSGLARVDMMGAANKAAQMPTNHIKKAKLDSAFRDRCKRDITSESGVLSTDCPPASLQGPVCGSHIFNWVVAAVIFPYCFTPQAVELGACLE